MRRRPSLTRNARFSAFRYSICVATTLLISGEAETARMILRDLVNATLGFEQLAKMTDVPSKSLHRMLSPRGNPSMDNLAAILSAVLVVWTLTPLYNMVMVSFTAEGDVFSDHLWPPNASADSFWIVLTQGYWYLEYFWHQFGNSVFIGAMVTLLVLTTVPVITFLRSQSGWYLEARGKRSDRKRLSPGIGQ